MNHITGLFGKQFVGWKSLVLKYIHAIIENVFIQLLL